MSKVFLKAVSRGLYFFLLFQLLALFTNAQDNRLLIDGKVKDWKTIPHNFLTGAEQQEKNTPFKHLRLTTGPKYLYVQFSLANRFNLTGGNPEKGQIYCFLDTDNNIKTGHKNGEIGAEIAIDFHRKTAYLNKDEQYNYNLDQLGIRLMPTVTSKHFELAIPLSITTSEAGSLRLGDTVRIQLFDKASKTSFPSKKRAITHSINNRTISRPEPTSLKDPQPSSFRVLSYNTLNNGLVDSVRGSHLKAVFQTLEPDFIALNECWDVKANTAKDFFNKALPQAKKKSWHTSKEDPGNITVSRYPIQYADQIHDDHRLLATLHDLPDKPDLPESLLLINAHLSCCNKEDKRQKQVKALWDFIRSARNDGGNLSISSSTPVVIAGDFNLVGKRKTLDMLLSGTGKGRTFDQLNSVKGRHLNSRMTFTWKNIDSEWPAGKLDYIFYSGNKLKVLKSFTLNTETAPEAILSTSSLNDSTTRLASDHLPLVADLSLKGFEPLENNDLWLSSLATNSSVKILTKKSIDSVDVVNPKGKTVYNRTFNKNKRNLSTFSMPLEVSPGIYSMIWFSDNEKGYKQFMIDPE